MRLAVKVFSDSFFLCRLTFFCILFVFLASTPWAIGRKDTETVTAEGGEIWQHDFDVTARRKGQHNYIVTAKDRAGNEAVSGPFNMKINPNAGLPVVNVVFPVNNAIIRQNINVLGYAGSQYGVERVMLRLDNGAYEEIEGTEYWSKQFDFSTVPDGRHTIYVQAFNSKGASGPVESVDFILDTSVPNIELRSHRVGDIIRGNVKIQGTVSDPNGIATLEYSDDGVNYYKLPGKRRGYTSVDFSVSMKTQRMPDGPLIYYVRAVDTTGAASSKPYLFFVDNNGPELEIYTPTPGEDMFGNFLLSGRAYDSIGIARLRYEWGRVKGDIEIRPGDPYWSVPLSASPKSSKTIKVTVTNKSGNTSSVTRKMNDRRSVKAPVLVIDYPPPNILQAMPADTAIYGRIASGIAPKSVVLTSRGNTELEALPSFRIDPQMIRPGNHTIRLIPVGEDGVKGAAVSLKINKLQMSASRAPSISITSPEKYSWHSGPTITLQGNNASPGTIEYRLNPYDSWQTVRTNRSDFSVSINISGIPDGPVHLEVRDGEGQLPTYHPINKAPSTSRMNIRIVSPVPSDGEIRNNLTVTGSVIHPVPVKSVSVSVDGGWTFDEIPFVSRFGQAWFSYFCNFFTLHETGNRLTVRVTDASGENSDIIPEYVFSTDPHLPVIIVNAPANGEVITEPFVVSGVAFYESGISGVYWRFLGPKPESVPRGASANASREAAAAYTANPDVPFNVFSTNQSFQIPVDFAQVIDGEYTLEIYASDPNGVRSITDSRIIKVSTAPPETRITDPPITRYNNKSIKIRGFSDDANGIASVSISMDRGNTYQKADLMGDGNWELALNTVMYVDGIYSALIRTEDNYGITSFSNAMINIDNTPPELYLSSPKSLGHTGSMLEIRGRVSDNIKLKNLRFQVISSTNPSYRLDFDMPPEFVISETISLEDFPQGEYIVRVSATDLADNETVVSRKIIYDADDKNAQIAIFNPLPGEVHVGTINIIGHVTGSFLPDEVQVMLSGNALALVPVDRYGYFYYTIEESILPGEGRYRISAYYYSETGKLISSPAHSVYYSPYGPALSVDSHNDGDVITKRPWLSGRAWVATPSIPEGEHTREILRQEKAAHVVENILISYDNGRTFSKAKGTGNNWKFRLETRFLPPGPQPVVIKAEFANNQVTVRRILLLVDTTPPTVAAIAPIEKSRHRDDIMIYGIAEDNMELADVNISLRPYDKFWYSVPPPIQGMYFDVKVFGATYFDVGLGLSFFKDNVRFQGQFGLAPPEGTPYGGRFAGTVLGMKLMANIFNLPFDYLFGPDWAFYSMNLAVGANFSWFSMDEFSMQWSGEKSRKYLYMGAVVAQFDVANVNMTYFYPNWKKFRNYALYFEPELWFASSDIQGETIFRMTIGLRVNFF